VTHKIRQHGAALWELLTAGCACVYVCGSAKQMPADVIAAFQDVASEHGGLSKEDAAAYVRQLRTVGRWVVEAWS
jgi:sulfite reductase (NADPH) flavoprotein alpha-component